MPTGSRIQVMNGTVDSTASGLTRADIKLNAKTGRYVSKLKSAQAKKKMAGNKRMQLRRQATQEVTTGRKDAKNLFKPGDNKIKRDVRKRYEELLWENDLPIKKKRAPAKKRGGNGSGWFY